MLAQWQENSVWYRARIQGREGSGYLVVFIDHGNTDICTSGQIVSCLEKIPEGAVIDEIAKEMSAVVSRGSTATAVDGHTSAVKPDSDSQTTASCDSKSAKQLAVSPENRPAAANQPVVSRDDSRPAATTTSQPVASQDSMLANQLDAVPLLLPSLTCYARWREDRVWYRCQILSDHGDEVEVLFTDYGNQDRVARTELVLLPTDIPAGEDKDVNVLEELEAVLAENNPDPIATSSPLVSKTRMIYSGPVMMYSRSSYDFSEHFFS